MFKNRFNFKSNIYINLFANYLSSSYCHHRKFRIDLKFRKVDYCGLKIYIRFLPLLLIMVDCPTKVNCGSLPT